MPDFKKIFAIKNTYEVLAEMNACAFHYYNEVLKNGTSDMEQLKYFLICLDRLYQEGFESPLRDDEYDEIHDYYIDHGGKIIRGDMSSTYKAEHVYPNLKGTIRKVHFITEKDRLSNGKVKSQKSFETWYRNVVKTLKEAGVWNDTIKIGLYTKFDGLSVILEIEDGKVLSAITRGDKDTGTGQNKTGVFANITYKDDIKVNGIKVTKYGMKCEALVSKEEFPKYNKKFGGGKLIDERSAATSILNNDYPSPEQLKYLTLMPLMLCVDGKEYPIPNKCVSGLEYVNQFNYHEFLGCEYLGVEKVCEFVKESITELSDELFKHSKYPVDGIVIRIENEEYRAVLGRNEEECVNNWERAYKFPPARAKTVLEKVDQEIGLLGKLSFVAKVRPVKLKNRTIKSISIGSLDRFVSLELAVGDEVWVQYDIIPYLTVDESCKKSGSEPIKVITNCPDCGEPLQFVPELSCVNPKCPTRAIGKMYNYCMKLGMDGIGPETIAKIYYAGIKDIAGLYDMNTNWLIDIGFGKIESKNILEAIDNVKSVDDYVFFGALGIPSVSRKIFEKVFTAISYKDLLKMDNNRQSVLELSKIDGIKSKTARRILDGIEENLGTIEKLLNHVKLNKGTKYDVTVCFTKIRDHDFEKYLQSIGVGITEALTRKTTMLIAGSMDSTKVAKAKKWGIPIVDINTAYKTFKYDEVLLGLQ